MPKLPISELIEHFEHRYLLKYLLGFYFDMKPCYSDRSPKIIFFIADVKMQKSEKLLEINEVHPYHYYNFMFSLVTVVVFIIPHL